MGLRESSMSMIEGGKYENKTDDCGGLRWEACSVCNGWWTSYAILI